MAVFAMGVIGSKMSCFSTVNFEFSQKAIADSVKKAGLLSIELELSLRCNFKCPYCYVPDTNYFEEELLEEEIRDVILQAKEMGAKKITILGGEPTIYPGILEIVRFISQNNLQVEIFSNGSGITADFAKELFANNVRMVLKKNTLNEELQDKLTGKEGAFKIINSALENLQNAGYPSNKGHLANKGNLANKGHSENTEHPANTEHPVNTEHPANREHSVNNSFLAVSSVICKQNIAELPDFWQWLRNRNIVPYFEIITPQANAKINDWLEVPKNQLQKLFQEISDIDRKKYGFNWDPQPPLMGNRCLRHQFSCLVTSKGDITPCVGVTIPLGNIREQTLSNIIKNSSVLNDLKNYQKTIKGPCGKCEKSDGCYGCRGAAYQLTGDYLASDPLCWLI
ncbi:MAG: hypothetical protein B6I31_05590 [Desulfobacteraceae bacterium 4572_19]|nr:MAG: hypothetical protein B6I31_05590 [Desulfobacteraceae bacterium 4572_19]